MNFQNLKKEGFHDILVAAIVVGFAFSFRSWGYESFSLLIGLSNWLSFTILALISILFRHLITRWIASKYLVESSFKIWDMKRFWFAKNNKFPQYILGFKIKSIKLGVLIPILFSLLTNGILKIITVGNTRIKEMPSRRIHKKYKKITEFESAVIYLTGPISNLLLALIFTSVNAEGFSRLIEMNYLLAILHLLPLPGLDGIKVFFHSRPLYLFIVAFSILSIAFIQLSNIIATLILSIVLAFLIMVLRMYQKF